MSENQPSSNGASVRPETVREHLRKLDRRQWWMWSSTVLVLILLSIAVASFSFPRMLNHDQGMYSFYLNQAVRSLVGLVLIFSVYLVYQQTMIIRMRNQLADQIAVPGEGPDTHGRGLQASRTRSTYRPL